MIEEMIVLGKLRINILLFFSAVFSLLLVVFRVHATGSVTYVFLIWNLILAGIPYLISTLLLLNRDLRNSKFSFWMLFGVWFIFLPNAPYIITDMFHLRSTTTFPIWYDLLLILSFAWIGLILCYLSISDLQELIKEKVSGLASWIITLSSLLLSGFGIYLGRFLRWNSWDLVNNPGSLIKDIANRILHPIVHLRTWGVTFGFGIFLILGYLIFKEMTKNNLSKGH